MQVTKSTVKGKLVSGQQQEMVCLAGDQLSEWETSCCCKRACVFGQIKLIKGGQTTDASHSATRLFNILASFQITNCSSDRFSHHQTTVCLSPKVSPWLLFVTGRFWLLLIMGASGAWGWKATYGTNSSIIGWWDGVGLRDGGGETQLGCSGLGQMEW